MENKKVTNLDEILEKLRPYLRRYLEEREVDIKSNGWFRCINPDHEDKNPSCGFVSSDEEFFKCFSCGAKGGITNAAYLLEDKPISGKEFIQENVLYLADKYGLRYETVEMSPEELHIRRVRAAYEDAADIISDTRPDDYITERVWPRTVCEELQIGSVLSYDDFLLRMKSRGYDKQFLDEIDLNCHIFNSDMFVFTVRDELNRVAGFSGRNMTYTKGSDIKKFINTSSKCPLYNKSNILYGLNIGRKHCGKHGGKLYIFEGYPDFVTAYTNGMRNICAIGGTALTREHISLLRELGVNEIILALDGDSPGQHRTESILDEYFGEGETIRVLIQKLPEGEHESDPDDYIKMHGINAYRNLPLLTPFQWRLERFSYDDKPDDVCDKMIQMILNDPNEIHRETMAKELSEKTGITFKSVLKQIDKLVNIEEAKVDVQVQSRLKQAMDDIRYNRGEDPVYALESAASDIRQMHSVDGDENHSEIEVISYMEEIENVFKTRVPGLQGWKTGFDTFDAAISGIPKRDCMVTFAGDSNVGKSGLMFDLALRLAKNNDNIIVLFMSIDDSRELALSRLVAIETGLRIDNVSHPLQNIKNKENEIVLANGWTRMRKIVSEGKFSLKDNSHGNTLDFAEAWIRWARDTYPEKDIAFFLDNFHKLGDEWSREERIRFKHASARIHNMKNKLHFTAVCTMELRKLMQGVKNQRPMLQDISESKQMEYDNNLIGMVYNDLKSKRHEAETFWVENDPTEGTIRKPVLEVDIQKNKISDFNDILYYKFDPPYSRFYESSTEEIKNWKRKYDEATKKVMDKMHPDAGLNPFAASY